MKKFYFYLDNRGIERGPVSLEMVRQSGINSKTMVWFEGMPLWVTADKIPEFGNSLKTNGIESLISSTSVSDDKSEGDEKFIPPIFKGIDDKLKAKISRMKPKNWMVESILVAIFCNLIFGIIALIYGSKVDIFWSSGEYAKSINASRVAGSWVKWGFMITFVILFITILILILFPEALKTVGFYNYYWTLKSPF